MSQQTRDLGASKEVDRPRSADEPSRRAPSDPIGRRRLPLALLAVLATLVAALVTGGIWYYRHQEAAAHRDAEEELVAIAHLKIRQIEQWRAERLGDAAVLSRDPLLAAAVGRFVEAPDGDARQALVERLRAMADAYGYRDVTLVELPSPGDPTAPPRVILNLQDHHHDLHEQARAVTIEAAATGLPLLSELHNGPGDLGPHIDAVAPLPGQRGSPTRAAVILQANAGDFLFPLLQDWPARSLTGETLIVERNEHVVRFLNELRHQQGAALTLTVPLTATEVPAVMAVEERRGAVTGVDYRGVPVIAVIDEVPGSKWFLVAKVDVAEALAAWRQQARIIVGLVLGLVLAAASLVLAVWQRNDKAHFRALFESEAAQRVAERRAATLLMSIGDGVIATDAQGRVEVLNPVAEHLTGWPRPEATGRPVEEVFRIVNEDSRAAVANPVRRVIEEGVVVGLANHTVLVARDGAERPILDSGAPVHDDDGTLTGVVLVFRDQSDERRQARELRDSEQRFRSLVEGAPEAIFVQTDQCFAYLNPAALALFGASAADELLGTPVVDRFHPDVRDQVAERIRALNEERRPAALAEETIIRSDGSLVDAEVLAVPVRYEGRDGAVVFARDLSWRRHAAEIRERLEEQLQQAQKMEAIGRLAGGVAHDFNNMLQSILGNAELALAAASDRSELTEPIEQVRDAARRSAELTRQLLAFARRQTAQPKVLELNLTLESMLRMLRRVVGENVALEWRPGFEPWQVRIDPSQLDQVLANLVVNARDALGGGGRITVATTNVTLDERYGEEHLEVLPGQYVQLAVSDTGRGMSREVLQHVFEPFFTTKPAGQGTGLGLATVYGIVRQNGGHVSVYSEPGHGATFKVFLPRWLGPEDEGAAAGEVVPAVGGSETVLVVEDEEAILSLCQRLLGRLGYRVLAAAGPLEALELIATEPDLRVDLLLTDVVMPQMSGRELAERLAATCPGMRRLYMSGYTDDVIADHGVLDSSLRFLQKPFSAATLAAAVRTTLDADLPHP